MAKTLWLDLETRSKTPIDAGVYRYAADTSFRIVLFGWAIDDEPAQVVDMLHGQAFPPELADALKDPACMLIAHNANFDRVCLRATGVVDGPLSRWRDSMILALSVGLPGALADLCGRFKMPTDKAKDADGRRLVRKFCVPDSAGHFADPGPLDLDDWQRFLDYCRLDVEAMREVWKRTPKANDSPGFWAQWHLDQKINDRGALIDRPLADACASACAEEQRKACSALADKTSGRVTSAGQRARILSELESLGVKMPDLQQSTVAHRLADPSLPPLAREILLARVQAGKASVAKFDALQLATGAEGRLRGTLQFCGAARTGRWSGRLFQPQNLPRGSLHGEEVETAIRAFKSGCAGEIFSDVQEAASSCLRGCIIAPKGSRLVVADLSNIEGRMLAWLAGETWKLDAFRAFDEGRGPDIYRATYARTFGGRPEDVTKEQRQVGKILELAMGYGGGAGAFKTFADAYGMDMDAMADLTLADADPAAVDAAREAFDRGGAPEGMSERVFLACDVVKTRWRAAHPATVRFWADAETRAKEALRTCSGVRVGPRCTFIGRGNGLFARLPSGRCIAWPGAQIGGQKGAFRFLDKTGWAETYGGRIVENLTQAAARDILADSMARAEEAGFRVVLHVHDELICEAPEDAAHDEKALSEIMATPPAWAFGLPLAAAGFTARRYRKD